MICEGRLHPFGREGRKDPTLRDMHLHRLPWPLKELESLGETQVEMRVTLSYFIEPNPSERGSRRVIATSPTACDMTSNVRPNRRRISGPESMPPRAMKKRGHALGR